ncbi:hypothetical protein KGC99_001453, partial [Enterococcus hirae]|nr:hypothetical protein [Enterococcus hirae]
MSNEKLDQNTLISILGEVNEATPAPAKNSANNNPSVLSSAKMENSTSILGETTGSKSFMAMTAAEKK